MKQKILISAYIVIAMWLIKVVDWIIPFDMDKLGIYPRHISGLFGIVLAPFLHANLWHLMSNTLPIFFLTLTLLVFYEKIAFKVWTLSALGGGLLVWLFARSSYHLGMSGVIFSLIAFLVSIGLFRKSLKSLLIAIVIFIFYGGAIWGILPLNPHVSWEGHLFGALTGIALGWYFSKKDIDSNDETTSISDKISSLTQ